MVGSIAFTPPCLARPSLDAPSDEAWLHEIKFDGYRVQALIEGGQVRLLTRRALDWTPRFGRVVQDLAALSVNAAVIDGEAVALDDAGVSNFSLLQQELKKGPAARITLMAFDLLHLDGSDTTVLPLTDRKAMLERLIAKGKRSLGLLRYSNHMAGDGAEILGRACAMRLEGIVSKRPDRPYHSGRTGDWVKTKCVTSDPFVVIGYVPSKAASGIVGSLVLGFYDNGELVYAGRVGSGFAIPAARALAEGLGSIEMRSAPLR